MNKYLKIKKSLFFNAVLLLLLFISSLIFISNYKVEESFQSKLVVNNDNNNEVFIPSNNIYKINYDSKLILFYDNNYHEYKISYIRKQKENFILEIYPVHSNIKKLIPGSSVQVSIVYSYKSIINIILNYFK